MRRLGNKVTARDLAASRGRAGHAGDAAVARATPPKSARLAAEVGYPVMLKASWGGGGRGMRVVESDARSWPSWSAAARREAQGRVRQRRGVPREARAARASRRSADPRRSRTATWCTSSSATARCSGATRRSSSARRRCSLGATSAASCASRPAHRPRGALPERRHRGVPAGCRHAAQFYFIEVNPRIQVEHTVTEAVTGIDIVKAQIRIAEGATIGTPESGVPRRRTSGSPGTRMQCRVTTEDPENNFIPDYGRITAYRSPGGLRHPARCRHGLHRRDHHALLRFAAGEGDGLGADARGNHRAHASRAVGIPRARRRDQPALPRPGDHAPAVRAAATTRPSSSTRRRSCSVSRASAIARRACCSFIGDVIVNGNPGGEGPRAPAAQRRRRASRACLWIAPPRRHASRSSTSSAPRSFAQWMLEQQPRCC